MGWVEGGVLEFSEMGGTQNGVCFWNRGVLTPLQTMYSPDSILLTSKIWCTCI